MLGSLDLTQKMKKAEYVEFSEPLNARLGRLQRELIDKGRPVLILMEGVEAAGKGDSIRRMVAPLDPRGFKVHLVRQAMTEEEKLRPILWRYWLNIPGKGEIGIFDRSWYMPAISDRVDGELDDHAWSIRKDEIKEFERQLVDDGVILIKFWLHISEKEQGRRFKKMEKSIYERWRVTKEDWRMHKNYKRFTEVADEILVATDTPYAPWTLVASTDRRHRRYQVMSTLVETLDRALAQANAATRISAVPASQEVNHPGTVSILDRVDTNKSLTREEYIQQLKEYQARLLELEYACYSRRLPVVITYEGWDAAGKGGNIKRVTQKLDPRGYDVISIAAPQGEEARRHYLWRFWKRLPKAGHIAIFDRTWYGRVMVERIEGFCREEEWKRAYYEINEFERHLADFGTVIIKFWLHISPEEQLRRFQERETIPDKSYKLTEEDWRNREKWKQYADAVCEMIERTSTNYAPWTIVEGNCKWYARVKTLKTIVKAISAKME